MPRSAWLASSPFDIAKGVCVCVCLQFLVFPKQNGSHLGNPSHAIIPQTNKNRLTNMMLDDESTNQGTIVDCLLQEYVRKHPKT